MLFLPILAGGMLAGCGSEVPYYEAGQSPQEQELVRTLAERYGWLRRLSIEVTTSEPRCFDPAFMAALLEATKVIADADGISEARSLAMDTQRVYAARYPQDTTQREPLPADPAVLSEILGVVSIDSGTSNLDCTSMNIFAYSEIPPGRSRQARYASKYGLPPVFEFSLWDSSHHLLEEPLEEVTKVLGGGVGVALRNRPSYEDWWLVLDMDTGVAGGILSDEAVRSMVAAARVMATRSGLARSPSDWSQPETAETDAEDAVDLSPVAAFWADTVFFTEEDGGEYPVGALYEDGSLPESREWRRRIERSWAARDLVSEDYSSAMLAVPLTDSITPWKRDDLEREVLALVSDHPQYRIRLVPVQVSQ